MSLLPQDAYERALRTYTESLTAGERKQIEAPTTLDELLERAKAIGEALEQPRLRQRFGEVAEKIKPFEKMLAATFKVHPIQGGDLIWASIAFVLESARNSNSVFEEVSNFFLTMSVEMSWVQTLEQTFKNSPRISDIIKDLYVVVLGFWVEAVKYYRRLTSKRARAWSNFKNFMGSNYMAENFQSLRKKIVDQRERLITFANVEHIKETFQDISNARRKDLISWIKAPPYTNDLHSAINLYHAGTCEWITEKETFVEWRNRCQNAYLVIYGIPGSGKTILSSWLITQAQDKAKTSHQLVLYHFFKDDDDSKSTPLSAVRSLLKQLYIYLAEFNEALVLQLEEQLGILSDKTHEVTFTSLWTVLSTILPQIPQPSANDGSPSILIILDALDECQRSKVLVEELRTLFRAASGSVTFVVTARKSGQHVAEFSRVPGDECLVLEITTDDVGHDIASYTQYTIEKIERLQGEHHTNLRNHIITELQRVENHQGMFLWSYLMCKQVQKQVTSHAILQLLKNPPKGLDATYSHICVRLAKEDQLEQNFAKSVLQWIVTSSRPLRFSELEHALRTLHGQSHFFDDGDHDPALGWGLLWSRMDIVEACGDLVTYSGLEDGDLIGIVHLSARHFLSSAASELSLPPDLSPYLPTIASFLIDIPKAECAIAITCLDYLLASSLHSDAQFAFSYQRINYYHYYDDKNRDALSKRYPLFDYSNVHWPNYTFRSFSNSSNELAINTLVQRTLTFIAHPFSIIWLLEYVRHFGAPRAKYSIQQFSNLPAAFLSADLSLWANRVVQVLRDFSHTISQMPPMIGLCLQPPGNIPNVFQPRAQIVLMPDPNLALSPLLLRSNHPPLEKSNGRWVYYHSESDSVFSVDLLSGTISLKRHIFKTGMPLHPAVHESTSRGSGRFNFKTSAVSSKAKFIAVSFTFQPYDGSQNAYIMITVCWRVNSSVPFSRTNDRAQGVDDWARVACVDELVLDKSETGPLQDISPSLATLAFRDDHTLIAPNGTWNILTGQKISPDGTWKLLNKEAIEGATSAFASTQAFEGVCISGNGERMARICIDSTSNDKFIEVLGIDGALIRRLHYKHSLILTLHAFSRTGEKLLFYLRPDPDFASSFCLLVDSGIILELQNPQRWFAFTVSCFFSEDEKKVISIREGVDQTDNASGEHFNLYGACTIAAWTIDQGNNHAPTPVTFLYKICYGFRDIAFSLARDQSVGGRSYEEILLIVTNTGDILKRRVSEIWTEDEEVQLSSYLNDSSVNDFLGHRGRRPSHFLMQHGSHTEMIACLLDMRNKFLTVKRWQLGHTKPALLSCDRDVFRLLNSSYYCPPSFVGSTGKYLFDVGDSQILRALILDNRARIEPIKVDLVVAATGCAFSPDDSRFALAHFEDSEIALSIFPISEDTAEPIELEDCIASLSLHDFLNLGSRSEKGIKELEDTRDWRQFVRVMFGNTPDVLAISLNYYDGFRPVPIATMCIKLMGNKLVATKLSSKYMESPRFSPCGKYLYDGGARDDKPDIYRLPKDYIAPADHDCHHPLIMEMNECYVHLPYIYTLFEHPTSVRGILVLYRKSLDRDKIGDDGYHEVDDEDDVNNGDSFIEIAVKPDALPKNVERITLLWPEETQPMGFDELIVAIGLEVMMIRTGIRSKDVMSGKFWKHVY